MSDTGPPPPQGRGAALRLALEKRKLGVKPVGQPEEPPKPRGRAALLERLHKSLPKVGASPEPPKTTPTVRDIVTETQNVSITEKKPVFYRGESGKPLNVSTNFIRLSMEKGRGVFEYEVKFNPELDAKNQRIRIVSRIVKTLGLEKVFDGGSCLYLPRRLDENRMVFDETTGEQDVTVTIVYKKKKSMGDSECLHLYNVLFKKIMYALLHTQIGKNYFDVEHRYLIPQHRLEVIPGFAVTVDELEDGLLLCLDTQHRVLRSQNAYELLNELRCRDQRHFKETAASNIIGSCVFTRYNNRTYVVDDIAWDMTPKDAFETRDGASVTFVEYYKRQYNIDIKDVNQPLLVNRKTIRMPGFAEKQDRMVCLVPELSYLTGLTDAMRNDFKVMKDVAQYTRVTPQQRAHALKTYLRNVTNSEKARKILGDWGLGIAEATTDLQVRQLDNEVIAFGDGRAVLGGANADWNRAASENPMTTPVDITNWVVFFTKQDSRSAKEFAETMVRISGSLGCSIAQPRMVMLENDRSETYITACRENIHKEVQVAVFVCPSMRSDRYAVIKKTCCVHIPVASQVINSKTLSNPSRLRSIIVKIALQINCKLGGALWTVRLPFKGWMIAGIDVYHGTASDSVCALVCSLNDSLSRWHSTAIFQEKELGDFYKAAFAKTLERYRRENGAFPAKVVIVRDGVSDGQLEYCRKYEVEQFESVLRQFGLETKLCFVVVQKRISTKLYGVDGRGGVQNAPSGTVVDHTITRKYLNDFFLVPQSVRSGTVNPTHYIVVHDACNLKPDHVQRLCYKLCHLYYNWPGAIRVPAPCLYAHKLASLVGQYVKTVPSAELCDKLFYL